MFTASEQRICWSICLCLLAAVLSAIALLNLTFYVTLPARKTLNTGFLQDPIVCETLEASENVQDGCDWVTCGEWCLSKSSGCMQINVTARMMGPFLKVSGCNADTRKTHQCYPVSVEELHALECAEKQCKNNPMDGTWYCNRGFCRDVSKMYDCPKTLLPPDEAMNCEVVAICKDLTGIFECADHNCRQYVDATSSTGTFTPMNLSSCTEKCSDIQPSGFNLHLMVGYTLEQLQCERIFNVNGSSVEWEGNALLSCRSTEQDLGQEIHLSDCFNGVLVDLEEPRYSMKELKRISHLKDNKPLDVSQRVIPMLRHETEPLLVFNKTKLQVNMEGCVNTLQDECHSIFVLNGRDGKDGVTQPATYPCYYAPGFNEMVILKFNEEDLFLWGILLFFIPLGLLIVSCSSLCFCAKAVYVEGERMYFRPCGNTQQNRGPPHHVAKAMAV